MNQIVVHYLVDRHLGLVYYFVCTYFSGHASPKEGMTMFNVPNRRTSCGLSVLSSRSSVKNNKNIISTHDLAKLLADTA